MMRSLFSGVSGLKTHQTRMDVIGNNIANVNTVAYKSSSMTFASLMSQTMQKASGANAATGTGGVNARQIGLGVKTSAINSNIGGQGAKQSTGNPFDIMINGQNFFVVSSGGTNYFTRDGSFYVDGAGNLAMTSIGYNVMGWQVDPDTGDIKQDKVSALRIMNAANQTYPPAATTDAYLSGIIDKYDTDVTSEGGKIINLNFFDSLGYSYTAKFAIKQSDNRSIYSAELVKLYDSKGKEVSIEGATFGDTGVTQKKTGTLMLKEDFSWTGKVLSKTSGGTTAVSFDLSTIVDNNNAFKPLTDVVTAEVKDTSGKVTTPAVYVRDVLEGIADAYGFSGSAEEFLNVLVPAEPKGGGDKVDFSVRELLLQQGNTAGEPDMGGLGKAKQVIETSGRRFMGVNIEFNANNGTFKGLGGVANSNTAVLNLSGIKLAEGNFENITIDFSKLSNVDNKGTSTATATNGQDNEYNTGSGRRVGAMSGITVQQDGRIYGTYDNGMTKLLGQIATAKFPNASGLEKLADNLYAASLNSGAFDGVGVDISANGGYMSTGMLEMSNVDLSSEFTEMITTQRGFQANSRIITVSDTLLEELTNLKR